MKGRGGREGWAQGWLGQVGPSPAKDQALTGENHGWEPRPSSPPSSRPSAAAANVLGRAAKCKAICIPDRNCFLDAVRPAVPKCPAAWNPIGPAFSKEPTSCTLLLRGFTVGLGWRSGQGSSCAPTHTTGPGLSVGFIPQGLVDTHPPSTSPFRVKHPCGVEVPSYY